MTFSFDYFGSTIVAEPLGLKFIPPLHHTITAHCIPITDDGRIVAADVIDRGVDIPGGHIDDGETAEETMRRETLEETFVNVDTPILVNVWRLSSENPKIGLREKPYLLLYTAKVTSFEDFKPNNEVSRRLVLTPDEFVEQYFGDKSQARKMVDQALTALR